jgi:peptidoglycan L-alanyl-D-glutamate endopeptidase CwlK
MNKFSPISSQRLLTCDQRLQEIMVRALSRSKVDFGIAEGQRTIQRQIELFKEKKTGKDGVNHLSKHNYNPSLAVDIYGWVDGKMDYSIPVMCYLAGVIESVAGEFGFKIRWGGNWDGDGIIITDQNFDDLPHFEIVK